MGKMHSWKVRDGSEKDLEGILSLRRAVFGEIENDKLDFRFWQWEFMEGPDGKGLIYIVEDGEKIVGHFADIPRRFFIYGKVVRGTLSVDLMVDSNYRRKGIFEEMGRYAIRRVLEEGNAFLTAYPIRKETIAGLRKCGWKEVVSLPVLVYPLSFSGIVNRYLRFLPLSLILGGVARILYSILFILFKKENKKEVLIEKVGELDNTFESFLKKGSSFFSNIGVRDREYLTWRYLRHPTRHYEIYRAMTEGEMQGYIILRKVNLLGFNSVAIVDMLSTDREALLALITEGIAYGRREKADLLGIMIPETHPYGRSLKQKGFLRSPKTFRFMIYAQEEDKRLWDPNRWHLTWGDTDVI